MTRWEQLRFLIGELQHEMPEYGHYAVPQDEREAFDLFRALCAAHRRSDRAQRTAAAGA